MTLSLAELVDRLCYPAVWMERGLYPEDLFQGQLEAFATEAREHGVPPQEYCPVGGTEHYRYGAFRYWLQRNPGPEILHALMEAAVTDSDPPMAGAAIKDLLAAYHPTRAMLELAIQAVRRSKGYLISEEELRVHMEDAEAEKKPIYSEPAPNEGGMTELQHAAYSGDLAGVLAALRKGDDVNVQDQSAWTPLHWVVDMGMVDGERAEILTALI